MALPTLFLFRPDGSVNPRYSIEYLTDVMSAARDKEVRHALRGDVPLQQLKYTASFGTPEAMADFRAAWYASAQPLRFLVPIWPNAAPISSITSDQIAGEFLGREFRESGVALLLRTDDVYEVVSVVSVADDLITTEDPVAGSFPVAASELIPCMIAWLAPPSITPQAQDVNSIEVSFTEEFQGIAGIDETLEESVDAAPYSIALFSMEFSQPFLPVDGKLLAIVRDRTGARLPNAHITWSTTSPNGHIVPSIDTQMCLCVPGAGDGGIHVVADCGDAHAEFEYICLP